MNNQNTMKQLSGLESYGQGGSFKGSVSIESEKFDSLPEETKSKISDGASTFLETLQENIALEWAKVNEVDKRNEIIAELTKLFESAGFNTVYVETVDNEYCSHSCCYYLPWIVVTTQKGRIKLGWRKRVINIDWSEFDIKADGREIFKGEDVTTGKKYVHAWGYNKAVEYLSKLNSESK